MDGLGFEHCFPKFGFLQTNEPRNATDYKIPDPPNHEKKRKDEILDITAQIYSDRRNQIQVYQIQKDHKGFFNHPGHVIAVYLVKTLQPADITQFIRSNRSEAPQASIQRYRTAFGLDSVDPMNQTEQMKISLVDSITMMPINTPARGEVCTHLQCFDLETYIEMNSKYKRWSCPFCNKRCSYVRLDPFFD